MLEPMAIIGTVGKVVGYLYQFYQFLEGAVGDKAPPPDLVSLIQISHERVIDELYRLHNIEYLSDAKTIMRRFEDYITLPVSTLYEKIQDWFKELADDASGVLTRLEDSITKPPFIHPDEYMGLDRETSRQRWEALGRYLQWAYIDAPAYCILAGIRCVAMKKASHAYERDDRLRFLEQVSKVHSVLLGGDVSTEKILDYVSTLKALDSELKQGRMSSIKFEHSYREPVGTVLWKCLAGLGTSRWQDAIELDSQKNKLAYGYDPYTIPWPPSTDPWPHGNLPSNHQTVWGILCKKYITGGNLIGYVQLRPPFSNEDHLIVSEGIFSWYIKFFSDPVVQFVLDSYVGVRESFFREKHQLGPEVPILF
jgi:hypothetical protein